MENKFDEFYDTLDNKSQEKFNNFLNEADTDLVMNSIKENIKLLLYNKREIIKNTKKILANNKEKLLLS